MICSSFCLSVSRLESRRTCSKTSNERFCASVDDEHNFPAGGDAVEEELVYLGDQVVLVARQIGLPSTR